MFKSLLYTKNSFTKTYIRSQLKTKNLNKGKPEKKAKRKYKISFHFVKKCDRSAKSY